MCSGRDGVKRVRCAANCHALLRKHRAAISIARKTNGDVIAITIASTERKPNRGDHSLSESSSHRQLLSMSNTDGPANSGVDEAKRAGAEAPPNTESVFEIFAPADGN